MNFSKENEKNVEVTDEKVTVTEAVEIKKENKQPNNMNYKNTILQNIHKEPNGAIIGVLPKGNVTILENKDEWVKINKGWIQKKYLTK